MLRRIYSLPLFWAFVLAVVFIIGYAVLNVLYNKSKWLKVLSFFGFALSIWGILYITIFKREAGIYSVELTPFYSFIMVKKQPEMYRTVFMNWLLYVPLGVFTPYLLFKKHKKTNVIITVLLAFILSVVVERIQFVYSLGMAEADDVIFNILGAFFGVLGYCLSGYLIKKSENIKNKFLIWFGRIKSKRQVK